MRCAPRVSRSASTTNSFLKGRRILSGYGEAGFNRWIVITRDDRIRYNQLEKQAVIATRLRFFSITSSSLTGDEAAALILSALERMSRLCRQYSKRGFLAKISRGPDVKIIEMGSR
jgi:PIN like domain